VKFSSFIGAQICVYFTNPIIKHTGVNKGEDQKKNKKSITICHSCVYIIFLREAKLIFKKRGERKKDIIWWAILKFYKTPWQHFFVFLSSHTQKNNHPAPKFATKKKSQNFYFKWRKRRSAKRPGCLL